MRNYCRFLTLLLLVGSAERADSQNVNNPFLPYDPDQNTLILYHFDEQPSSMVLDASGNTLHGLWTPTPAGSTGRFGNAITLSGVAEVISTTFPELEDTDLTVEAWIYPLSHTTCLVADLRSPGIPADDGIAIGLTEEGHAFGISQGGHLPFFIVESTSVIPLESWTHVAVVFPGTAALLQIYVNGNLEAGIDGVRWRGTRKVVLGKVMSGGWGHFTGLLDEFRVSTVTRGFSPVSVNGTSWGQLKSGWE